MKNLKTFTLVLLVTLLVTPTIVAQNELPISDNTIELLQSNKRYFTKYMIQSPDRRYYTSDFQLEGDFIKFNECKRDGSVKFSFILLKRDVKIYKSKKYTK